MDFKKKFSDGIAREGRWERSHDVVQRKKDDYSDLCERERERGGGFNLIFLINKKSHGTWNWLVEIEDLKWHVTHENSLRELNGQKYKTSLGLYHFPKL